MSKAARRYYRTIILGLLAMGALIWVAMDQFGISRREMSELFLVTLMVVGLVIAAAAVVALMWMGLRSLLRRDRDS